jgi:uncharacterized protein YjdB
MSMDEFYNANNRTWQLYLNITKLYSYSLFSNAVVFALANPIVEPTEIRFNETNPEVTAGEKITLSLTTAPFQANSQITFASASTSKATVTKIDDRHVEVTGVAEGTSKITASATTEAGTVKGEITVTVNAVTGE